MSEERKSSQQLREEGRCTEAWVRRAAEREAELAPEPTPATPEDVAAARRHAELRRSNPVQASRFLAGNAASIFRGRAALQGTPPSTPTGPEAA